ncbi:hypothetical protein EWE75_04240 [Sphingomonas populi]|uniref:Prohead serine protease domain-containing protein n=1 Tax=Sphingomonas populi TaxID=2484750 RepID=A0A4V2DDR1_9SPHN|nr:prohead protease/major capsid protein fusion protein [Sphingomonas populi]RZF65868.1 hypothetical protein EWE75_04240 [Sphingomonas populi]
MTSIQTRNSADQTAIHHRAAELNPGSWSEADSTIDVIWTTGAPVKRFNFYSFEQVIETLDLNPASVRLGRLNSGACVLDSHKSVPLAAAIGSVIAGSAKIERGKGIAKLRLSDTPDVADTVAKIRAGHLRNISVGYEVHTFERFTSNDGGPDELHAIDWEPVEISFVTVPADPGAQVRSGSSNMARIVEGGSRASRSSAPAGVQNRGAGGALPIGEVVDDLDDADEGEVRAAPRGQRSITTNYIRDLCGRSDDYSRSFERQLIEDHAREPFSRRELEQRCRDELYRVRQRGSVSSRTGGEFDAVLADQQVGQSSLMARMENALYARMSGRAPTDDAREFMGARMVDLARGLMEARGETARWDSPSKIVQRLGQHTTSDFPIILGNAAARYLLDVFQGYPSPLKVLAKPRSANDFKALTIARLSANPALLLVPENAEFKRGTVVEAAESYALQTYGRIFSISRQAIINDDLAGFTSVFSAWGRAAGELEANLLAGFINGNGPVMHDGNWLYSAAHGNLAPAGLPITVGSLSAGRQAMRQQTDIDGATPLNIAPKYLVVGAAKETEAEQVLAQLAAATTADVNPFSGKLELVVDSRLTGNAWRLFADPSAWPTLEIARLAGQEDVYVETRAGFDVDGVDTKARLDIGAAAIDWRGTYQNPGQ